MDEVKYVYLLSVGYRYEQAGAYEVFETKDEAVKEAVRLENEEFEEYGSNSKYYKVSRVPFRSV